MPFREVRRRREEDLFSMQLSWETNPTWRVPISDCKIECLTSCEPI